MDAEDRMAIRNNAQAGQALALTPREVEVLRLLACGCTYSRVGDRLGVTVNTVTSHIKNAYRKLDVHSAAAAVMRAVELGLFVGSARESGFANLSFLFCIDR
jgi:DNA-binding NarL/FixJ family response regulator